MSELTIALSRRALRQIFSADVDRGGIRRWIEVGGFYFEQGTPDSFTLRIASIDEFRRYQLFDYGRFAFSSVESMSFCRPDGDRPRALGWSMLKAYYAGFFGAHAIMRALGKGIVRLEAKQADIITLQGASFDASFKLKGGTFRYVVGQRQDGAIEISFSRTPDGAGVHESFWTEFVTFIRDISQQVADENESDALIVVGKLTEMERALSANGSLPGSWLSVIRNKINYQHEFGVWFPYGLGRQQANFALRLGYKPDSQWRLDLDQRRDVLEAFSSTALHIASINTELAELYLGIPASAGTRFARSWQRLSTECGLSVK